MSLPPVSFNDLQKQFDPSLPRDETTRDADAALIDGIIKTQFVAKAKPTTTAEDRARIIRRRRIEGVSIAALSLLVGALICGGILLYKSHAAPLSLIGAAQSVGMTAADAPTLYITAIACGGTVAAATIGLLANRYRKHRLPVALP
ncbi:MAG: hypothetical protein K1000chlam4_00425 [Chlamydiae bacterium]|nr:hypothetical protein [Chlamydiota bacterium]